MIEKDDLRAAVGAGMLTEAQAASLTALADSRRGARETMAPGDEPFELFKGFNEIFIVVGLIILTIGWVGVVSVWAALSELGLRTVLMGAGLFGGGVLCLMSEYFIRRRRMVAPAIACIAARSASLAGADSDLASIRIAAGFKSSARISSTRVERSSSSRDAARASWSTASSRCAPPCRSRPSETV